MINFTFKTVRALQHNWLKKLEWLRVNYETNQPHPGSNRRKSLTVRWIGDKSVTARPVERTVSGTEAFGKYTEVYKISDGPSNGCCIKKIKTQAARTKGG
jgi:hypothetical protein